MCQVFFLFEVKCNQRLFPVPSLQDAGELYKLQTTISTLQTSIMVFYMQITIKSFLSIFAAFSLNSLNTQQTQLLYKILRIKSNFQYSKSKFR